jgi:predicted transcriptional regulator
MLPPWKDVDKHRKGPCVKCVAVGNGVMLFMSIISIAVILKFENEHRALVESLARGAKSSMNEKSQRTQRHQRH